MKKILALMLALALILACFVGCDKNEEDYNDDELGGENPIATIVFKDYGTMKLELYPDAAPETVKNFISLANSGFYDGLTIHRISPNFVIQGGAPDGNGRGGPGYTIKGEFYANGVENNIKHEKGVISMARLEYPYDSAGSQFFICTDTSQMVSMSLDGKYAGFGKIITDEGFETLDKIAAVGSDANQTPLKKIKIESIKVNTKGVDYGEPNKIK